MFREMDICAKLQKLPSLDPVAVPAVDILQMATTSGASLLASNGNTGVLEPSAKADIILINIDSPHLQPMHSTDLLVYAASGADVRTVLINGQPVMRERKILSFDLEETMYQVRLLAERVKKG
jgi:5-methylthioadenosine/S-adenosylhomocysteine deaminase